MKKLLVKNSLFGIYQSIINILLVFIVVPVFIKMLGSESYGVFALVIVVGNLNTFTNLGLTNALVKFISEQGKSSESNIDIIASLVLTIVLILPLTIIAISFNKFVLLEVLGVPLNLFQDAKWLYYWILSANFFLLIGQIFKSILDALQKIYITSLIQAIYNILYWCLILIALLLGHGLLEIGLVIFISAFIWLLIIMIISLNEWGKISLVGLRNNFKTNAKKQLKYGLKIYTGGLIGFFSEPLMKILVSNYIGVTEVGFFDIALKLRNQLWGIISKIFYPLFPFISEQKDKIIVRKYIHDLEQKAFFIVVPIIAIIIIVMHPFVSVWLGNNVEIISLTAIFIIVFYLLGSSTVVPIYQFLLSKNLAEKTIIIQFFNTVFYLAFFFLSVKVLGYYALILSYFAAIMSSFILSLYYQKKYLDSLIFNSTSQIVKLLFSFIILIAAGVVLKGFLDGHNILIIITIPIFLTLLTILLYKFFHLIKIEDIHRYFGRDNLISKVLVNIYNT